MGTVLPAATAGKHAGGQSQPHCGSAPWLASLTLVPHVGEAAGHGARPRRGYGCPPACSPAVAAGSAVPTPTPPVCSSYDLSILHGSRARHTHALRGG